jgi:hypothetical protein
MVMIPRVTIREAADADVIRKALAYYLETRKVQYHKAATTADVEETMRLSVAYQTDKEYVCGLLRAVGDGTMVTPPTTGTDSEDNDNE